ncbi:hypothetical protein HK096_009618 [Nowakowskiella sp. JEL0078]|nr:hypothetical protein HK096_009618 [Nowakowskiella sp. JEL0078]
MFTSNNFKYSVLGLFILTFVSQVASQLTLKSWAEVRAQFPNAVTLYNGVASNTNFSMTLHWEVQNNGTSNEVLHMAIAIVTPFTNVAKDKVPKDQFFWPFIGVGFGKSMVNGNEFVLCQLNAAYNATLSERGGTKGYGPPPVSTTTPITKGISGGFITGVFYCEFTRPVSAPGYTSIKTNSLQPILWAFNPTPTKNVNGEWLSYHGIDRRGYLRASSLTTGAIVSAEPVNYSQKQAHGAGMAVIWLLIFPSAVLWSRYLRSVPNWLFIHMGIQTVGASGVLALVSVIAITVNGFDASRPHSVFGIILVVFLVIQVALGVMNLLGLIRDSFRTIRKIARYLHAGLGMFLLVSSIVQVGLGLDLVYPFAFKEDRGIGAWLLYFVLAAFWIAIFVFLELFFRLRIRVPNKKAMTKPVYNPAPKQSVDAYPMTLKSTKKDLGGGGSEGYQGYHVVKNSSVNARNVYNPVMPFPETNPSSMERSIQFTWDSLDKEILKG